MDDWKLRIQYPDRYEVILDKTEKEARKILSKLKSGKQVVWCELIHYPVDADETVVDSFENQVITVLGKDVII